MKIIHKIHMDLDRCSVPGFDTVRGDRYTRELEIDLFAGGEPWQIPAEAVASVRYERSDGIGGSYDRMPDGSPAWRIDGNAVTVVLAPAAMAVVGCVILTVTLVAGDREISTFQILMNVQPAAGLEVSETGEHWYLSGSLPQPADPQAGELLEVTSLDDHGLVNGLRTVPRDLTDAQFWSLEALLKQAKYRKEPQQMLAAFREAFGRNIPATGLKLSSAVVGLSAGATKQLHAILTPENSTDDVDWSVSDPAVATVEDGLITPVGNGVCKVTATVGSLSATCTVSVTGFSEPVHEHSYTTVTIKTPTCTEAGLVAGICRCGDAFTQDVPALGHDYVDGICTVCNMADPSVFTNSAGYYNAKFVRQTGYYDAGALTQGDFYYNTGLMAMGKASKLYFKWYDVGTQYVTYFDANGNYLSQTTGIWSGGRKIFTAPAAAEYVAVSYLDEENEGAWVMFNASEQRHTVDNQLAPTAGNITNVIHGTTYKCLGLEAVTSVTMGGEDITVQVYDSTLGMVIIPSVTGDVVIR